MDEMDCFETLFELASDLLLASTECKSQWSEHFGTRLSVPYNEFINSFVPQLEDSTDETQKKERELKERCFKSLFILQNSRVVGKCKPPEEVTYEMFAVTCSIYGEWWENPMLGALMNAVSNIHFFIMTSSEARSKLRDAPIVRYVLRMRAKPDHTNESEPYPFAVTLRNVNGRLCDLVVSYNLDDRVFFIKYNDDTMFAKGFDVSELCERFLSKYFPGVADSDVTMSVV